MTEPHSVTFDAKRVTYVVNNAEGKTIAVVNPRLNNREASLLSRENMTVFPMREDEWWDAPEFTEDEDFAIFAFVVKHIQEGINKAKERRMSRYHFFGQLDGMKNPVVTWRATNIDGDTDCHELPLYQEIHNHSIEFNWGYMGSGPAQLALAILMHYTEAPYFAMLVHQEFKRLCVASLKQVDSWVLDKNVVHSYIRMVAQTNNIPTEGILDDLWQPGIFPETKENDD